MADDSPRLVCAQCRQPVTADVWRLTVSGSHQHVFANPGGHIFVIGCFSSAPGCVVVGSLTSDFSWFSGTQWQIAVCAACGLHLGWRYTTLSNSSFFGLILNRLEHLFRLLD